VQPIYRSVRLIHAQQADPDFFMTEWSASSRDKSRMIQNRQRQSAHEGDRQTARNARDNAPVRQARERTTGPKRPLPLPTRCRRCRDPIYREPRALHPAQQASMRAADIRRRRSPPDWTAPRHVLSRPLQERCSVASRQAAEVSSALGRRGFGFLMGACGTGWAPCLLACLLWGSHGQRPAATTGWSGLGVLTS